MSTTMHGVAKGQQQHKLRGTLRRLFGDGSDFKSVPSKYQRDQLPYHAGLNTANAVYDKLVNGDSFLTRLPWKSSHLSQPRLHCHLVPVELAISFNRIGIVRFAKSPLGLYSDEELFTAALKGWSRYEHRVLSRQKSRVYAGWFNQLKAANLTKMPSSRSHFARGFELLYEHFAFEGTPKGIRSEGKIREILDRERLNRNADMTHEPIFKMCNQVSGVVMQRLGRPATNP